jgi:VWFA-related protein
VEVVVRNKGGPVTNLTRDDFTILDEGEPRRIDVFRTGQTATSAPPAPLPPNTVSNRLSRTGDPVPDTTVVLFDLLNTRLDLKAYETKTLTGLVRGIGAHDRTAIYWLGKNLHVLQDFTDDPAKLLSALTQLDSGRDLMPANKEDAMADLPTDA